MARSVGARALSGRLSAEDRKRMAKSQFGLPGSRGFPMNDAKHQRLAIGGATRSERAGNISASTAAKIKSEARAKLARGKKSRGRKGKAKR